jgi:hypothetical protein
LLDADPAIVKLRAVGAWPVDPHGRRYHAARAAKRERDLASAVLSDEDHAAIEVDRAEIAELKDMWDRQEIRTAEYRQMRKVVALTGLHQPKPKPSEP